VTRVVFNQAALDALLASPAGPVGRDLARRAINVQNQAKLNASGRPGPNVQTGRLRSSIAFQVVNDGGLVARVGSNVEYAAFVELGTDRSRPYPYLRPALPAAAL